MTTLDGPEIGATNAKRFLDEMRSWKKKRTQVRKQITNARNVIDVIGSSRGSRGAVKGLVEQLQELHREASNLCENCKFKNTTGICTWLTGLMGQQKKDNFIIGCPNLATSLTVFSIIRQQFAFSATGNLFI
jgi:hypothetical protein